MEAPAPGEDLAGRLSAQQVRGELQEKQDAEGNGAGEGDGRAQGPSPQNGQKQEDGNGRPKPDEHQSALKEWIGLLVRASIWAMVIYTFVFQVSVVKGASMEPNFSNGDRLLVDKLTYRFTAPQIGDVIVFDAVTTDQEGKRARRDYIKRVIAGPGDLVEIYDSKVHVNGQALEEPWGAEEFSRSAYTNAKGRSTPRFKVPPDRYFVLGDRRWDSNDSRFSAIGFVSWKQIKGMVRWRFYPLDRAEWFE